MKPNHSSVSVNGLSHKILRGETVAPRLVIFIDAWKVQKTKNLPLKVLGTGLENGFFDFQLFFYRTVWGKWPKSNILPILSPLTGICHANFTP